MRPAAPWTFKLAGVAWIIAGIAFALAPALTVWLTQAQYTSLRNRMLELAGTADAIDQNNLLQITDYLNEFDRIEDLVMGSIGWFLTPLIVIYAICAVLALALYAVISVATFRGSNWARVTGTVLACISTPAAIIVWLTVASLSWMPLHAFWANHVGLVLIVLQIIGVVLVWLPASNRHVRAKSAARGALAGATAGRLG